MSRTPPEWIAKHPDQKIPAHVKLRVFRRCGGRCYLSGRKITPSDAWDVEHIRALCLGGEHRESNLAPALRDKHKIKTRDDVARKAKADKAAYRQIGLKPKGRPFPGSRADKWKRTMSGKTVLRNPPHRSQA